MKSLPAPTSITSLYPVPWSLKIGVMSDQLFPSFELNISVTPGRPKEQTKSPLLINRKWGATPLKPVDVGGDQVLPSSNDQAPPMRPLLPVRKMQNNRLSERRTSPASFGPSLPIQGHGFSSGCNAAMMPSSFQVWP